MIIKIKNLLFEIYFLILIDNLIVNDFLPNNYRYFKGAKHINSWAVSFNKYFIDIKKRIKTQKGSDEDKAEIETYSFYAGYVARKMNDILRTGENNNYLPEYFQQHIDRLANSLNKFHLPENVVAIRRIKCKYFNENIKKGDNYKEKGFLSTSLNLFYRLDSESIFRLLDKEAIIILKIPKGTNACYIEEISKRREYELVLQKNTSMAIEKNIHIFGNRIIVAKVN